METCPASICGKSSRPRRLVKARNARVKATAAVPMTKYLIPNTLVISLVKNVEWLAATLSVEEFGKVRKVAQYAGTNVIERQ